MRRDLAQPQNPDPVTPAHLRCERWLHIRCQRRLVGEGLKMCRYACHFIQLNGTGWACFAALAESAGEAVLMFINVCFYAVGDGGSPTDLLLFTIVEDERVNGARKFVQP